ncbi:unnamed protein product, partial [Brassica oleracea]
GCVRVYTVCDESRSKKELFILTNRFGSLIDVNQWIQKTVRSLLMSSSGSSSVSSLMPGRSLEREMEYQFHRRDAPITLVSSDQEYFGSASMNQTVREKLDKVKERTTLKHFFIGL